MAKKLFFEDTNFPAQYCPVCAKNTVLTFYNKKADVMITKCRRKCGYYTSFSGKTLDLTYINIDNVEFEEGSDS